MDDAVLMFLDSDLNFAAIDVPYDNILWVSRYYDFGEYQIQIPAEFFSLDYKYVLLSGQRELGLVLKYQYDSSSKKVIVSGYFAEYALDRSIAFPRFTATGEVGSLCVDLVLKYYMGGDSSFWFESFNTSSFGLLPITPYIDNDPPTGRNYEADFEGENLGTKMFSMLLDDELSYRVTYSRDHKQCYFEIWKGRDRRLGNAYSVNNDVLILSEAVGSLIDIKVDYDESAYKNYCVVFYNFASENNNNNISWTARRRNDYEKGKAKAIFKQYDSADSVEDDSLANYDKAINIDARLTDPKRANIAVGDLVTLQIESIGMKIETRVAEVTTTYKNGTIDIEVGFGNKRVTNLQRAIGALR